jgi:carboxypeptidase C (cathepsin A)
MRIARIVMIVAFVLFVLPVSRLAAQTPPANPGAPEMKPAQSPPVPAPKEEFSVTDHTIRLGGQIIPYKATAGLTLLKNDAGEPTGLMYSVAYTRSDVKDLSRRPISFFYNGGPGSASLWLHMGAFGPRRPVTTDGAFTPPAPYELVDNTESLLDKTDMVFIDAMGTGFSRPAGRGQIKDFTGIDEDAQAFGQFILTYVNRNDRWNSPKFLMGESYGTFRSAVLGNLLQSRYSMHLNGIVLISSVLDLATLNFTPGDDRTYVLYLPSYAAVAWYHKVQQNRPSDLAAFVDQARKFAAGEYAAALFKGATLPVAEKEAVAKKLAVFTGLSVDYLLKADLRVNLGQFNVELMRNRGLTAGRIDARFTGYTKNPLAETSQGDPEGPAVGGVFTAMLNAYTHNELKFGLDKTYLNSMGGGGGEWNWKRLPTGRGGAAGGFFPGAPNVMGDLVDAMITNPSLYVQVENGYYDMATPFFATEYTMDHLGLPADLKGRLTLNYYPAGHMMYLQDESRAALHDNIARFVDKAVRR